MEHIPQLWTTGSKPTTPLSVSVSAPSTVEVGESFSVSASGNNGFGNYKYVMNKDAGSTTTVDFFGDTFSSTNSWNNISYSTTGQKTFAVAVKDSGSTGGNYALGFDTIEVVPLANDSDAEGNSLSLNPFMCPDEMRFVGFNMKNTGTATWTTSSYTLDLFNEPGWSPMSAQLPNNVSPGNSESIQFTIQAPDQEGQYDAYYKMKKSAFFGDQNGTSVDVDDSNCFGLLSGGDEDSELLVDPVESWLTPQRQVSVFPLRVARSGSDSKVGILNFSYAVTSTTNVDLVLRIAFDPAAVRPLAARGLPPILQSQSGTRGSREYWIRITGPLAGQGRVFQLPFNLHGKPDGPLGTVTIFR